MYTSGTTQTEAPRPRHGTSNCQWIICECCRQQHARYQSFWTNSIRTIDNLGISGKRSRLNPDDIWDFSNQHARTFTPLTNGASSTNVAFNAIFQSPLSKLPIIQQSVSGSMIPGTV